MSLRSFASTSAYVFKARPACCVPAVRHHSSHSSPPRFSPSGSTSAQTQIPYADADSAAAPYLPRDPKAASSAPDVDEAATRSTPLDLTPKQRQLLEEIIRVDQAGELGANYIYQGQHAVFRRGRDKRVADIVQVSALPLRIAILCMLTVRTSQNMWDGEKKHIATFDKLITQHGIRPTALYPVWKAAGWALGAGTAIMGKRAAMACTEAVETVIGEHYDS